MKALTSLSLSAGSLISSRVFYTLTQWVMLSAVARLTDLATVGAYGLALGIVTLVFRSVEFGMAQSANTDHARSVSDEDYLLLRNALGVLGVTVCIGLAFIAYGGGLAGMMIIAMAFPKVVEAQSVLIYAFYRRAGRIHYMSHSLFVRGALGVALFVACLWISRSVLLALVGQGVAWMLVAIFLDRPRAKVPVDRTGVLRLFKGAPARTDLREQSGVIMGLVVRLLPLALAGTAAYAAGVVPRLLMEEYSGLEMVGVFTTLYYPYQAANIILGALNNVVLGPISLRFHKGKNAKAIRIFFGQLLAVCACVAAGLAVVWFAGGPVLNIVYGPEYVMYAGALLWLGLAWAPRYLAVAVKTLTMSLRMFKEAFWSQTVMLVAVVISGFILVPRYDLDGAIGSLAIGHALFLLVSMITAGRALRRHWRKSSADSA